MLEGNVDARLGSLGTNALSLPPGFPGSEATAFQILEAGRQEPGFLLVLADSNGTSTGAVVDDTPEVNGLSPAQIERVLESVSTSGRTTINVGDGLGDYRVLAVVNRGTRESSAPSGSRSRRFRARSPLSSRRPHSSPPAD